MIVSALDTSVIVAALLGWHESHAPALEALVGASAPRGYRLLVPAPALVEAYSVLTRLPAPHRIAPAQAFELLAGSFERRAAVVSLGEAETWGFLRTAAERGLAGGLVYDALILHCAIKGGASRLLTLDRRDFERLELAGIELVVPGVYG